MEPNENQQPFLFRDCVLSAFSTGLRAQNIRELRDKLTVVSADSIYYHFWGSRLATRFEHPEYHNDFAGWVHHSLHDHILGERLGIIDPTDFEDLERLRHELVEIIEQRLDEVETVAWSKPDDQFQFVRSRIIVFDTPHHISHPSELPQVLPTLSLSSVFYHFIDARMRLPESTDDFRAWLHGYGEEFRELMDMLANLDPYFLPLLELRQTLVAKTTAFFESHSLVTV
jgi:hypothetical protein